MASIGSSVPMMAAEEVVYSYKDIKGHWAADVIEKWSDKGIVEGYSDGTFRPNNEITGTELVTFVNNLFGDQTVADLEGVPAGILAKPEGSVSRQDAITLLYLALGFEAQKDAWTTFKDMSEVSDYALLAINNMYERCLIEGYPDGTLKPTSAITRAAFIRIINNASIIGYVADVNDGVDANDKITIIKETRPWGELVYAMAILYDSTIDGTKLKTTDFAVDAIVGEAAIARTITKVYTNDSATTATEGKVGKYVIIELNTTTDSNTGTMFYDFKSGKNTLYKLNYYLTQKEDITAVDGTKLVKGSKQQSGQEVNAVVDSFDALTFTSEAGSKMDYRLYEPTTEVSKKYPLVIFLHGNGERGVNGVAQLLGNAGATVWASAENQAKNPSFVLAPQNPLLASGKWLEKSVYETTLELINSVASNPLIDTDRIYITGVSMGGFGTWGFIQRNPDLFAAAMPICGAGDLTKVEAIKDQAIWAFHASDDPVVKVTGEIPLYMPEFMMNGTRDMVDALEKLGSTKVKYTEYEPGYVAMPLAPMAHFSWVPAYGTQEAIDWMFEQAK